MASYKANAVNERCCRPLAKDGGNAIRRVEAMALFGVAKDTGVLVVEYLDVSTFSKCLASSSSAAIAEKGVGHLGS